MELAPHCCEGEFVIDELSKNLSKFVDLNEFEETHVSEGDEKSDLEDNCQEGQHGKEPIKVCLGKSATFPCPGTSSVSLTGSKDNDQEATSLTKEPIQRSLSMTLVPAMKGSREKQGLEPRKLNVKWAPDVYDPIPNSLSHTVQNKPKKYRKDKYKNNHGKKNGKKAHKGNSSRGVGGSNKQRSHKFGGNGRSEQCYRPVDSYECRDDHEGFEVNNPDYCSSRFLKTSLTKVHYSVTEAL